MIGHIPSSPIDIKNVRTILLADWPSADVPRSLVEAGFRVIVKGGPHDRFLEWTPSGERIEVTDFDADILYIHRPLDELPHLIELGQRHGVNAVWRDPAPGSADFRALVEAAGLVYIDECPITAAL